MSALPDDIWETALQTWQKAHVMSLHEDQVRILAEAIRAERERCAKIAGFHNWLAASSIRMPDEVTPK